VEVLRVEVGAGVLKEGQLVFGNGYILELWQGLAGAFHGEDEHTVNLSL
jgi:hypothetical protein